MNRGTVLIGFLLAALCALVTAVSAYSAGATTKSLLLRVTTSAILAGSLGIIFVSWFRIKMLQSDELGNNMSGGHAIDIEVSDDMSGENEWQPMDAEQISEEDARVFPARK